MNIEQQIHDAALHTIESELTAAHRLTEFIDEQFIQVVKLISESKGRVIIAGIGKSAIIAQKIVATLNSTGTPALFLHAADAIHGDLGVIQPNDMVIVISKSGSSPEIKVLIPMIRNLEQNNILVGMVSETNSFLGENSDYILRTTIEREACPNNLAPTTSTTLQLIMGDALAMSLVDLRHFTPSDYAKYHPGGALGKRLYLHVGDLVDLQRAPRVIETETIRPIIIEMTSNRLGATAVIDSQAQVTGIITDGDLRRMLQKEQDITQVKASDIMSRNPRTIDIHEMAVAALRLMEKSKITQLIATEQGKYVGMIHMHDILKEGIV